MNTLYQVRILDHATHPRNFRVLEHADVIERAANSSCGDSLTLYLVFEGERITEASFTGEGCAISQAAASLLTERLVRLARSEARDLSEADIYTMLGAEMSIGRRACALLAFRALRNALDHTR